MDESSVYRALIIGVGVFIAIATITGVLTYYNTAKAMVQAVGTGTDFDTVYTDYVENILLKADATTTITGEEVVNLVNYFYKKEDTQINIKFIIPLHADATNTEELLLLSENATNINNDENVYNEKISKIVPSQKFKIRRESELGKLTINLEGIK